ncbi:hypothetical protein PPYR_01038 [Photinus pyralis]|uniref:Integrase core domain-containing protein n=2 Tax=Photinus pyralis TaxID=7054 RepID=A0A5N4B3F8_PHOPY|nr:uncharacterized protein LOC116160048 isoform X1 [Photinus pyralis]XP_031352254.1 uncharacterized protein LOC116177417 [Photinus pyralis]KAB0804068.1 hypothetical protein PPYR_01038 [Photinus pyralis]
MEELISFYFRMGLQQCEIVSCLALNHSIFISDRHLRRLLRKLNLFRRQNYSDITDVANFIENSVHQHSQLHGYRWMYLKCLQANFVVTQEVVRLLLHIIDPVGVDIRTRRRLRRRQYKNKGPNFLWHMDCYDKLKPFGICISGCIDGFSRRIMWLYAGNNTSDPSVIAAYYLLTLKSIGGCPRTVRADMGTENGLVKEIQINLRNQALTDDGHSLLPPFLYGKSTSNQRIESWWSILRKHHSQFWLNLFHKLREDGNFSGDFLDKNLIQFCFLKIIQDELDTVALEWNLHRISGSRNSVSPRGRPFTLYHMPQIYDTTDNICHIPINEISNFDEFCAFPSNCPCDRDVYELSVILMIENDLHLARNAHDATDLYLYLRAKIVDLMI